MKILQIVNPVLPFPATTVGGTERIVQYLTDELVMKGHEVTLMGHDHSIVSEGVKFIGVGTYLDRSKTIKTIWKHLLFNKYDVIHNHGRLIHFLPSVWTGTRKVHTFHMAELESEAFHRFSNLNPRNFTFSPCSEWIQRRYTNLSGHWNYVHNGLPENLYTFDKKKLSSESPLLIICRLAESKGVLDAIKIALMSNRKLIIAGAVGDYPHEKRWFNEVLAPLCDGIHIRFIGAVNDAQKNELLNNAAALLIPTVDSEAFNTTMLEANACGCPVISYNRFCFTEFIIDGVNGYKGETIQDLIGAVNKIDAISRHQCRQIFEDKYTAGIMTENYLTLYKQKA